ncbi:hypothetical protein A3K73_03465 [Candidatus Pacearchaeota archaeon RBG_13_36_9]|nr:MAG: hypothetical protein A3K73_03465 [Candidatus Pacearchaeota archaeon RBG_13_36_9]
MGSWAVIGITSIGDDRCPHGDRRFERFADSAKKSRKYNVRDLDGRAILVQPGNIVVYNSIEAELREGSVLVVGLQRDTTNLISGREVNHDNLFSSIDGKGYAAFLVHPCHMNGSRTYLEEAINNSSNHQLNNITGIEVVNGEAYFPLPWEYRKANKNALNLFLAAYNFNPNIAPVRFGDGHALFELGRITTKITYPQLQGENGMPNGDAALKNLKNSFRILASEFLVARKTASVLEKTVGTLGAVHHGFSWLVYRPLAMKLGIMTEKDW